MSMLSDETRQLLPTQAARLCPPLVRKEPPKDCCLTPRSEIRRPDPAIYSRAETLKRDGSNGQVTWQNPDIVTNLWRPARLLPEAQLTVHNLSAKRIAPTIPRRGARRPVASYIGVRT
jgi:hypothetical protein